MNDSSAFDTLARYRLVPVIVCGDASRAADLGKALVDGGLPIAEVTLRTPTALDAIEQLAANDQLLVGAGTVLSIDAAQQAIDRGAKFIVSPGLDEQVVQFCLARGVAVLPGVATPSELQHALGLGLSAVKFFPAEAIGGVRLLKALAGPFPGVRFVPTGGISADNLGDYLHVRSVLACGGSWMVKQDWIDDGKFAELRSAVRQAVELATSS